MTTHGIFPLTAVIENMTKCEHAPDFIVFGAVCLPRFSCGTRLALLFNVTRAPGDCRRSFCWVVRRRQSGATRRPVPLLPTYRCSLPSSCLQQARPKRTQKAVDRTKTKNPAQINSLPIAYLHPPTFFLRDHCFSLHAKLYLLNLLITP